MSRPRDDGRAVVEFVFLGILMLLPLLYLVLTTARLQAASFAASLASREAGRAFVTGRDDANAAERAHAAAGLAFADFAFERGTSLQLSCDGSPCLRPEGAVTIRTSIAVELPLIPDVIASRVPSALTVTSTHLQSVDRFVAR